MCFANSSHGVPLESLDATQWRSIVPALAVGLEALGWDVVRGCANFLLCHTPQWQPKAIDLIAACRRRGLFIRDVANMGICFDERTVRVAVKDHKTNCDMLDRLRAAIAETTE